MAADPRVLEEIDVERHTARQISTLIARELGLPEPESLTPSEVVVQGKERALRQSPDDVLSPPAKPGTGMVKLQLQEIAAALIAGRSAANAKNSVAKVPPPLQMPDDLSPETLPPTPDRIEQALGGIAQEMDAPSTPVSSASAPPTPDAGSGGKTARMKSMLDPNEAAGFPRGLRKSERQVAVKSDVPETWQQPGAEAGREHAAAAPSTSDAGSDSSKKSRIKSMLDPNQAAGFPRGVRKSERQAVTNAAVPEPQSKLQPEAHVGSAKDAKNQQAVRALLLCQVCRSFGIMLRMQTETQIWLNAFAGDFAGQARAQGTLESISGILGFMIGPILGGLSDAYGRRPLMIMCVLRCPDRTTMHRFSNSRVVVSETMWLVRRSPCFSVATNILIVSNPTVSSLVVRRLLMPFSSTPWHSGEAAALADMFKTDPAAYSVAKSRIEIVNSAMQIVCPLIGARLAAISLRLPWAICGVSFSVMIFVAYKCVHSSLYAYRLQRLHADRYP